MPSCDKKSNVRGGATIKDLDADLAIKLVIGAARMRVLVYTLVSGVEHVGMDDTRVTTAYISLDDIKQDSAFMTFARQHLPSGVGHAEAGRLYGKARWVLCPIFGKVFLATTVCSHVTLFLSV